MNAKDLILAIEAQLPGHSVSIVVVNDTLGVYISAPGVPSFGVIQFAPYDEYLSVGVVSAKIVAYHNACLRVAGPTAGTAPS